jgi:hypothetical protein
MGLTLYISTYPFVKKNLSFSFLQPYQIYSHQSSPNVSSRIKFNLYFYLLVCLVVKFLISEKESGISMLNYLVVDAVL